MFSFLFCITIKCMFYGVISPVVKSNKLPLIYIKIKVQHIFKIRIRRRQNFWFCIQWRLKVKNDNTRVVVLDKLFTANFADFFTFCMGRDLGIILIQFNSQCINLTCTWYFVNLLVFVLAIGEFYLIKWTSSSESLRYADDF